MDTHRRSYLAEKMLDAQTECAWATHRLSLGFEGPPEWREAQAAAVQDTVDHHRRRIATLRAKLGAIEDPRLAFGDDDLPKFLRAAE